ncbi:MAG: LysM peptidoglycan-binding domain-containing protein [Bacteroidota bacterium]
MINAIFLAASLYLHPAKSDSLRLETVNGQTFIVHLVGEKETMFGLSKRYGVTITRILEFNPTADGGIEAGQLLKIPYIPKGRTQTAAGTVHKVQPKETLFSISRMYSVPVDDIKAWNNLKDNALSVGQDILIKKESPKPQQQQQQIKMTHTVAAGETLYSIAKVYSVSVDQLKQWNNLQTNDVKLSQTLFVAQPMFAPQTTTSTQQVTQPVTTTVTPTSTVPNTSSTTSTTTPVQTASAGSPVKISETVLGTDEVHELGLAELIEGSEGNRKYLAFHRTAKPGSILKVRNELNNRECL